MYEFFRDTHSILRWIILMLFLYTVIRYMMGLNKKRPFDGGDESASLFLTISLDIQLLAGLMLYFFLSPYKDMPMNMKDSFVRFWKMEHLVGMLLAVVIAHLGKSRMNKNPTDAGKFKTGLTWYIVSLLLILATIPWPFRNLGGSWFPWI